MNKKCKIGFIGCGKMASAIIKGTILSKFLPISILQMESDYMRKTPTFFNIRMFHSDRRGG